MKLSHYKKANLDARYTSYDPEQELESDQSLVKVSCPLHGTYYVPSNKLQQKYLWRTLRSAGCPDCLKEKRDDYDYLYQVAQRLKAYRGCPIAKMNYEPHPDWHPLPHWQPPILLK